jgi:hypothetical protein
MPREIKFRVWTGHIMEYNVMTGKFGTFFVNPSNNGLHPTDLASLNPNNTKYPEGIALMQYTGVKDASGKTIGTYKTSRYNVTVSSYSTKDVKFTLKKSSLKKKKFDLRNATITRKGGAYYYR